MVKASAKKTDHERLAYWISNFDSSSVPKEIYERVRLLVLDTLGVMLLATRIDLGKIIIDFSKKQNPGKESYVFGVKPRVNAPLAGLVGGTLGHGDELDDVHLLGGGHVAASVVPTSVCMADVCGSSVKEFLHAVLTGYEVAGTLAVAIGGVRLCDRNFHPSGVVGTFGCTASACKLLSLNHSHIAHALGLTAGQAAGTIAWHTENEHMTKSFQLGVAARNAITASLLAAEGFTSCKSVFDGKYNIFQTFGGIAPPAGWMEGLGVEFQILHSSLKKYSAGRPTHAALDALSFIEKEYSFALKDVEQVEVRMPPESAVVVDKNPTAAIDCQWIVAKALTEGVNSLMFDEQENAKQRTYRALMNKISLVYDKSLSRHYPEHRPAIVKIRLRSGKILEKKVIQASGSKSNPLSQEQIISKFRVLSQPFLGEKRAEDVIDLLNSDNRNMRQLTKILTID